MYRRGGDGGAAARRSKQDRPGITIRLDATVKALVALFAAREGVSVNAVVADAVNDWLQTYVAKLNREANQ